MRHLKVSDNHRFLVHADGRPFFYLADTAWELFHRLNRADTIKYLRDRAAKRFTAIQAVALAEEDGLRVPNRLGDLPLTDFDPTKPNEPYWQHVDWVIDTANSLGLFMALLPTWGDKWNNNPPRHGPEIFTPDNAFTFGRWIGGRYRDRDVIWVLGGDRHVENDTHRRIIDRMADGVREAVGDRQLITFHPRGHETSAKHFHQSPWLDFNMWQTGHARNRDSYNLIAGDYALTPTKPVIDAEPGYEDHPSQFSIDNGYLDDYDVRKFMYWSLFAGACGHTYGAQPIWQFWNYDLPIKSFCRRTWEEGLLLPGSGQVQHGRALIESRPVLSRVPDQSMIVGENPGGSQHVQATRDSEGRYAFVYCACYKQPVTLDLSALRAETLAVHWFDPRTGSAIAAPGVNRGQSVSFQPPLGGPDWVLVLDDPAAGFGPPGA